MSRELHISDDLIRRYSRRGNFHSEAATADDLGLPGLVAQGTQVCGPAVAELIDAWGTAFFERAELDLRFTGMVVGGQTVRAEVAIDADRAQLEVHESGRVVAVGSAFLGPLPDHNS